MKTVYDVIIIGAGPAGYTAAVRLSQLGKSVCLIELSEEHLGGACLNQGCVPTKFLENVADIFHSSRAAGKFGLQISPGSPDMKKMLSCSEEVIIRLRKGIESLLRTHQVDLLEGRASFISRKKVKVVDESGRSKELEASYFIIATGSRPRVLAGLEPDNQRIITSARALKLEKIPRRILIVGGGAIGCEFGSLYNLFGSEVTIVEVYPQLLPAEDAELSRALSKEFKKRRIDIFTSSKIEKIGRRKQSAAVSISTPEGPQHQEFEYVLLSIGRTPDINGLGLGEIGLNLEKEFIAVNEFYKTNLDNIYAIGDVINTPMFAYLATREGRIAAESIAGEKPRPIDYANVPRAVHSTPQVGSVGLTELQAKEGGQIKVYRRFFKANSLAVLRHRESGFVKIITEAGTGRILGAHIIGPEATELIHEFALARAAQLSLADLAAVLHVHPSFSEILQEVATG